MRSTSGGFWGLFIGTPPSAVVITNLCHMAVGCVFQIFPNFLESNGMLSKTKQKWLLTRFWHKSRDAVLYLPCVLFPISSFGLDRGTHSNSNTKYDVYKIYIYSRFSKPKLLRQILIWNTEWKVWISHLIVLLL